MSLNDISSIERELASYLLIDKNGKANSSHESRIKISALTGRLSEIASQASLEERLQIFKITDRVFYALYLQRENPSLFTRIFLTAHKNLRRNNSFDGILEILKDIKLRNSYLEKPNLIEKDIKEINEANKDKKRPLINILKKLITLFLGPNPWRYLALHPEKANEKLFEAALLSNPEEINELDIYGESVILQAAETGNLVFERWLKGHGANFKEFPYICNLALKVAIINNDLNVIKAFVEAGEIPDAVSYYKTALSKGYYQAADLLEKWIPTNQVHQLLEGEKNTKDFFLKKLLEQLKNIKDKEKDETTEQANKKIEIDIKYGTQCRSKVEELEKDLKEGILIQPEKKPEKKQTADSPVSKSFCDLPPSNKGTRRAAALLEKISIYRSEIQNERSGLNVENFQTLRHHNDWGTPICGRYLWAYPLTLAVHNFSKAEDINRSGKYYELKYKNLVLNKSSPVDLVWKHGFSKVEETWPYIEDLFEELMAFNFAKPTGKAGEEATFQIRLTEFYSKAAELVWLIGNTQPLERGSGTFAEFMLGIIHLANGLEPPTLKPEFPQLDVLDITFPLSDYKKFFPYFFEPSTMPEHLRRPSSSKSILAQIEDLYKEINSN